MTLPLFVPPSSPTVSSQIGIRVNAKRVQFGDGYVQRQEHAVNARKRVANWQWSLLSHADTDARQFSHHTPTGFRYTFPNTGLHPRRAVPASAPTGRRSEQQSRSLAELTLLPHPPVLGLQCPRGMVAGPQARLDRAWYSLGAGPRRTDRRRAHADRPRQGKRDRKLSRPGQACRNPRPEAQAHRNARRITAAGRRLLEIESTR